MTIVIAGLVPAIRDLLLAERKTWIAVTSTAMTNAFGMLDTDMLLEKRTDGATAPSRPGGERSDRESDPGEGALLYR